MTTLSSPLCSLSRPRTSFRSPSATCRVQCFYRPRITKTYHTVGSSASSITWHSPNIKYCTLRCLRTSFLSPFTPYLATRISSRLQSPVRVLTVTSSKRDRRPKPFKKRRMYSDTINLTPPTVSLIIGAAVMAVLIATTSGVVLAGAITTLVSLPIILAIGAAIIPLLAISSFALAPLLPLLGAFGLFSVASGNFVGLLFDKLLCTVLCINFLGAAFSAYRRVRNRDRQLADDSDADLDPLAGDFESPVRQSGGSRYLSLVPSFVSVIPQINGLGWFLTLSDAWDFLPLPRRATLIKNAILYSVPGFFWAAKGVFLSGFAVFSKTPSLGGSAWWVALLLGAIHLQFERSRLEDEAQAAELALEDKSALGGSGGGRKKELKKRKITAAERQSLEWTRELEEFDVLLGKKPSSTLPGENGTEFKDRDDDCRWLGFQSISDSQKLNGFLVSG